MPDKKWDGCMLDKKAGIFEIQICPTKLVAHSLSIFSTADVTRQASTFSPHREVNDSRKLAFIIGFAHSNNEPHQTNGEGLLILRFTICGMILHIAHGKLAGHWKRWRIIWAMGRRRE